MLKSYRECLRKYQADPEGGHARCSAYVLQDSPANPPRPDDRFRSRMLYALRFYDVLSSVPLVGKMHGRRARDTTVYSGASMSFLGP